MLFSITTVLILPKLFFNQIFLIKKNPQGSLLYVCMCVCELRGNLSVNKFTYIQLSSFSLLCIFSDSPYLPPFLPLYIFKQPLFTPHFTPYIFRQPLFTPSLPLIYFQTHLFTPSLPLIYFQTALIHPLSPPYIFSNHPYSPPLSPLLYF